MSVNICNKEGVCVIETNMLMKDIVEGVYKTYSPKQLAEKYKCSKWYVHYLITRLRNEGANIPLQRKPVVDMETFKKENPGIFTS